jgi:hypothetical protein
MSFSVTGIVSNMAVFGLAAFVNLYQTTRRNNPELLFASVRIWNLTRIISLSSIKQLISVVKKYCVFFKIRNDF